MSNILPIGISLTRTFGKNVSEETVMTAADAMISRGFKDAGYEYLIVGDGFLKSRRDGNGDLVCDTEKFPNGVKALADGIHARGLKLGVLLSAGAVTINGAPGSHENEYHDAAMLASWGVDYIALDVSDIPARADVKNLIRRWGMAVRNTGRPMLLAVYSDASGMHKWIRSTGAGSYCCRKYADARGVVLPDESIAGYSGDYCLASHGDITLDGSCCGASLRTQLTLAAIMSAPIIVDCDPMSISEENVGMLTDEALLSIALDPECRPARRLGEGVYAKFLDSSEYALAFVNCESDNAVLEFYTYDFGLTRNCGLVYGISPVFAGEATELDACIRVGLPPKDAALYRMTLK